MANSKIKILQWGHLYCSDLNAHFLSSLTDFLLSQTWWHVGGPLLSSHAMQGN